MGYSLDSIAFQIDECLEKINEYEILIAQLEHIIRELRWQPVETVDGDIALYDDVA